MGQATVDLPDPLQNTGPAEAKSADDLLSQLAGDEIDRLLAESESNAPAIPAPPSAPEPVVPPATAAPIDLDAVLQTAIVDKKAVEPPAPVKPSPPVDSSPQIELGDPSHRLRLFLRPLEWLSSPLDPWPDQLREILGKIGLITTINALAVLAYVLLFRRHH